MHSSIRPVSLRAIDSHTGGEPTRLIIDGFPDLGRSNLRDRRERFASEFDAWRRAIILEPRGSDVLVGALLCEPCSPNATAGVIFFNNSGYLGMCGHGSIGLVTSLAWLGRITAGQHCIETPVGNVQATLHDDGSVSIENIPAYRYRKQVTVTTSHGSVTGDIAWGGNWFFLVSQHPFHITPAEIPIMTEYSLAIRQALDMQKIRGQNGEIIDHIELFADDEQADSRNFVLCPGKAWDRSPCGTGTCARLACLAAEGKLAAGQPWRQASVIGSQFVASYQPDGDRIIPTLRGRAWISGDHRLLFDTTDPFIWGISH